MQSSAVQGVFPPSNIPNLSAMKSAAISSNEKIFPIFAGRLASGNTNDFTSTTRKLAVWLGSEKAYYAAARPKIVELLEIAFTAFVNAFMLHPDSAEFAEQLRRLMEAVIPFEHLFLESQLQSRLKRILSETKLLLSRLSASATYASATPQGSAPSNISLPVPASSVYPQTTVPSVPDIQRPVLLNQPSPSVPSIGRVIPDGSVHDSAFGARDPPAMSPQGEFQAIPSLTATNTPRDLGENVPATVALKPQPTRVRRAELSEALVARDLDWFKSNQAVAVMNEQTSASSSKDSESSPASAPNTPHISGQSPSLKKKTARMVPSRRLPRRMPLDGTQGVESGVSTSLPPSDLSTGKVGAFGDSEDVSVRVGVDQRSPSIEKINTDVHPTTIPEVGVREVSRNGLPSHDPQPVRTSPNEPHTAPWTDDRSLSVGTSFVNGKSYTPPCLSTVDGMESMDMSVSDLDSESDSTPLQPSRILQIRSPILPALVNAMDPPLNLQFRIPQISSMQPQQSEMDTSKQRFDGEMTVIHSIQGKPFNHTHIVDISLNESIFSKISKWVNRRHHPPEAFQGVCISLACYRLPELFDRIKLNSSKHDIQELTLRSSCSWPHSNRLSLKDKERQTIIPLSPPPILTLDQCVDISSLMKLGSNALEIRQNDDLSEYLIVLHAHRPTRAQLAELDVVKTADERWRQFLNVLSARPTPGKVLDAGPAGVP